MAGAGVNFLAPVVSDAEAGVGRSSDGTKFNAFGDGFTYWGYCVNKNCKAHTSFRKCGTVTKELGFEKTAVRPNEDEMMARIKCMLCETPFVPDSYILRNCSVKIDFKFAGVGQKMHTITWTTGPYSANSHYYLQLGAEGEKLMYSAVMIHVAKHNVYPNSDPDPSKGIFETYIDPKNKVIGPGTPPKNKNANLLKAIETSPFNKATKQLDGMLPRLKTLLAEAEEVKKRLFEL